MGAVNSEHGAGMGGLQGLEVEPLLHHSCLLLDARKFMFLSLDGVQEEAKRRNVWSLRGRQTCVDNRYGGNKVLQSVRPSCRPGCTDAHLTLEGPLRALSVEPWD